MSLSPEDAAAHAGDGSNVIGWSLGRRDRTSLLLQFPPRFENLVADHVTLRPKASPEAALPADQVGEVVGRVDDGEGVEAMIVRIEGRTDRPGGGTYHITWSLAEGRHARESNDVIERLGWTPLDLPVSVTLTGACWPRRSA